ncbi:sugar-binding domain-containing protein [Pannonibacter sp. Pt2-lr]
MPHPVNERSISIPLDRLDRVKSKVLISGGREKTQMMRATLKALDMDVVITDELTAQRLLGQLEA